MDTAEHYKVAHSVFLGWSKPDRDKAIWHLVRKRETCSGCGTRREEWDPSHGGHRGAYLATETVCPGCQQVEARKEYLSKAYTTLPGGLRVHLKLNPALKGGDG